MQVGRLRDLSDDEVGDVCLDRPVPQIRRQVRHIARVKQCQLPLKVTSYASDACRTIPKFYNHAPDQAGQGLFHRKNLLHNAIVSVQFRTTAALWTVLPMLLGYARVSTDDQDLTLQRKALREAGWPEVTEGPVDTHKPTNKEHRADKRGHKAPCDRFIPTSVWFPPPSWQSHNALLYLENFANKHYNFGLCVPAGPSVTSGL